MCVCWLGSCQAPAPQASIAEQRVGHRLGADRLHRLVCAEPSHTVCHLAGQQPTGNRKLLICGFIAVKMERNMHSEKECKEKKTHTKQYKKPNCIRSGT